MVAAVQHTPVLFREALELLQVRPGGIYADCTVGLGGHAEGILEKLGGEGRLIGLDRDPQAIKHCRRRLAHFSNFQLHHENFKNLPLILRRSQVEGLDGCLLDLGVSSLQLDSSERGFSFQQEGPLDMRMDPRTGTSAAQLVNSYSMGQLADLFRRYGEERSARKIARAIVEQRRTQPFRTTLELALLIETVKGGRRGRRIHPATRVFQALRIAVNQELEGLESFLEQVVDDLNEGGRLAVISFHSLEDRIIKRTFRLLAGQCVCFRPPEMCRCPRIARVKLLTRRPLKPTPEEQSENPRSRSAKLRALERLAVDGGRRGAKNG